MGQIQAPQKIKLFQNFKHIMGCKKICNKICLQHLVSEILLFVYILEQNYKLVRKRSQNYKISPLFRGFCKIMSTSLWLFLPTCSTLFNVRFCRSRRSFAIIIRKWFFGIDITNLKCWNKVSTLWINRAKILKKIDISKKKTQYKVNCKVGETLVSHSAII